MDFSHASNPKFSDIEVIDNYGGRKTDSLSQNIETFNFSVGIPWSYKTCLQLF